MIDFRKELETIAHGMQLSFCSETWSRANLVLDKFHRDSRTGKVISRTGETLPMCIYVQPVSGNFLTRQGMRKDSPSCFISFVEQMPFDFKGEEADEIVKELKGIAYEFMDRLNHSGLFEPLPENIAYTIGFDRLDANLCVLTIQPTLTEAIGTCEKWEMLKTSCERSWNSSSKA